jgi:hypothetical protein
MNTGLQMASEPAGVQGDGEELKTLHVRVYSDLKKKIAWIVRIKGPGWTSAKYLDPLIRQTVEDDYDELVEGRKKSKKKKEGDA